MEDLGFPVVHPMALYCENKTVISITHNSVQHGQTKHIEVSRHFIKVQLRCDCIYTPFVKIGDQLVDILTKGLSGPRFTDIVSKLGMRNISSPT